MGDQIRTVEQELVQLFHGFMDAGLQGRFEEALALIAEPFTAIGMGEQGIVKGKREAEKILRDSYHSEDNAVIGYKVKQLIINMLSADSAVILGEVAVTNTPVDKEPGCCGMMQTIGARREGNSWYIAFTHASPVMLSLESAEAYPIDFMSHTISALQASMQSESVQCRDVLTGILNREGLEHRSEVLLQEYNPKNLIALLMIDLDNFKQINDRMGHQTGDAVLRQVAAVLQKAFGDSDIVGRIGGDEFMVLLNGDFTVKFLEKKAEELLGSMYLRLENNQEIPVSISIGITCGRTRATFEKLYRIADIALYTAKKSGKARYHLINSDTSLQSGFSGTSANLLSLQTLLEYTNGKEVPSGKSPYEALVENIPGGVVMFEFTDTSIKVNHCNDWFSRLLGYSEEEITAQQAVSPLAFVHPEDEEVLLQASREIQNGADSSNIIYRVRHKDGSYSHMNQIISVTERRRGSIIMYGIETDVEETHRLKQEVEDSRNELETFLNAIPGGVLSISVTEQVRLIHRNQWVARFLGYDRQELDDIEKENAFALVDPEDIPLMEKAVAKMRCGAEQTNIVYHLLGKDGRYRNVCINASLAERRNGEFIYYGVVTDVEEMTKIQNKLEHVNCKLETLLSAMELTKKDMKSED